MNDVRAQKGVEIQINGNVAGLGTNIWVNVDGRCAVRVLVDPDAVIVVEDNRKPIVSTQRCICNEGFGMNLSCPVHKPGAPL